jgi:hypothetical protein
LAAPDDLRQRCSGSSFRLAPRGGEHDWLSDPARAVVETFVRRPEKSLRNGQVKLAVSGEEGRSAAEAAESLGTIERERNFFQACVVRPHPDPTGKFSGPGVLLCGGGEKYFAPP